MRIVQFKKPHTDDDILYSRNDCWKFMTDTAFSCFIKASYWFSNADQGAVIFLVVRSMKIRTQLRGMFYPRDIHFGTKSFPRLKWSNKIEFLVMIDIFFNIFPPTGN